MNTKKYKMFSKTQIRIMKLFVSKITKRLSLREVGKELGIHQALTYRACKRLIEQKYIISNDEKYSLNYRLNHQELAYIEHLRTKDLLNNKEISFLREEIIEQLPYEYFVLLIFGSTVTHKNPRDIDLLIIIEKTEEIEKAEKYIYTITRKYSSQIHPVIVSFESVYEMLAPREEKNVMTEVLNKHLILYGGELFYKLIKKGRK
jgi:predicted nucleotidyltransferase